MPDNVKRVKEKRLIGEEIVQISRETAADSVLFEDGQTFQQKLDAGELKGDRGETGKEGATWKPSVDGDTGLLSWTQDSSGDAPESVSIKGPKGDDGKDGKDAKINGHDAITLAGGDNVAISDNGAGETTVSVDFSGVEKHLEKTDKRVTALEEKTSRLLPHRYVVRWDKTLSKCTRMYDAADITTDTTHFCYRGKMDDQYSNPFDSIYPWSHRKLCKADKAKYKELFTSGGDVMGAITKWEDEPDFKLGSDAPGMDMVYTPEFWMKQWEDGGYVYIGVADGPIYGWTHVPQMVQARYLASKDTNGEGLTSLAGDVPYADTISIGQLHAEAKKDNLTIDNIFTWDAETVLMVVEYADLNCQTAIGSSVSNGLYRAQNERPKEAGTSNKVTLPAAIRDVCIPGAILAFGTANDRGTVARRAITTVDDAEDGYVTVTFAGDPVEYTTEMFCSIHGFYNAPDEAIGSKSGYIGTDGRCLAYYRGRNCYGNCYHYLLGAYREQNTGHIWVAPDEATADDLDALNKERCKDTGCVLPDTKEGQAADGWIKELHLLEDYPMAPFCKAVNGDSSNPVGDYCWWPALNVVDTICIAGAYAGNWASVGRFAADWRSAASNAWWSIAVSLAFRTPTGGV